MSYLSRIQPFHLDVLQEVGNIGAGHAATALSQLLNKGIDMKVPAVKVVPFDEISELTGGDESVVAAVFLRIEGDAPGNMFFMVPVEDATKLIQSVTGDVSIDFARPPVCELGISAFNETGNIMAGSYLTAFSDFTSLKMQPTPPVMAVDMTIAILSHGLIELSQAGDLAIIIETEINEREETNETTIKGHFFLLPDPDSLKKIFSAVGVHIDE